MKPTDVQREMCGTCPFRAGSPWMGLAGYLEERALTTGNRICHSTGTSSICGRTNKAELVCRGARDRQLAFFHAVGFLSEPTDAAWAARCEELHL